jgi:hypothetical protein
MEAASRPRTAAAVHDLDGALAMLEPSRSLLHGRRLFAAYLSIESAKELLCDEREQRAVLLLQHARKMLVPLVAECAGTDRDADQQTGLTVVRHLENALGSLGTTAN